MSGIGDRFRTLPRCDRPLLLVIGAWCVLGPVDNYFRIRSPAYASWGRLILAIIVWATVAGTIAYTAVRQRRGLRDYGFSFKRGGLGSLAVLVALQIYAVKTGQLVPSAPEGFLWAVMAVGAFLEEMVFRVVLIDEFILLLDGIRGPFR